MMKKDGTFQEDIDCIIQPKDGKGGIFISNIEAASNIQTLKKHGIGAMISSVKGKNLSDIIPTDIEYLYIPAIDHESFNLSVFFKDSFELISSQIERTNVLVHCMAGVSRSVTLVIAYLMEKKNWGFEQTFRFVKNKRRIINPNSSFVCQLKKLEKQLSKRTKGIILRDISLNQPTREPSLTHKPMLKQQTKNIPTEFYDETLKAKIKELFKMKNTSSSSTGFSFSSNNDQKKSMIR